ncbi:MAG: TIGR03905 family TSCPD domain-containing protein [Coriobacteriales bacterium]|nr:TIGR03905 family TSCPD domain-containing protein [Coriobacteriales bacterium]MDD6768858.1 TIGR03905 family TSCPD domain-containing protein [Coriobacteriaceae bacterium]
MTQHSYRTMGVCSRAISFELDDDKRVHNVMFLGGCNGNLKGIGQLVEGMPAEEVIERIAGTTCGPKRTSCPDQLACALREALEA